MKHPLRLISLLLAILIMAMTLPFSAFTICDGCRAIIEANATATLAETTKIERSPLC